jgi:hypothetical protein
MHPHEIDRLAAALDSAVLESLNLAGGFSHETCLLRLPDGPVVARLGSADPTIEAAVMAAASRHVPVPEVLHVLPAVDGVRPAIVLAYVTGTPLSRVLDDGADRAALVELGKAVGRVVAAVSAETFDRPGFFTDRDLTVRAGPPWSEQLAEFAADCMAATPEDRLDVATRSAWIALCTDHAPALRSTDGLAHLVHADVNPKNILVSRTADGWRVDALLDWEFSYSGCPHGDAANMLRFGADYPDGFLDGFRSAYAAHLPEAVGVDDWAYVGRVLDMFALSDLVRRPVGHQIADQAAEQIRRWVADGVPDSRPG